MNSIRVKIPTADGQMLGGVISLPADSKASSYALFAHCFTCGKNLAVARNISRSLNQSGIGVLRFDFTGLGESDGEFSNTDFTSNLNDIEFAADYLGEFYDAPQILIGHSLGGAAVLAAAERISSARAIVTIGAPFQPGHVSHLFAGKTEELESTGKASISLGGKPITIGRSLVKDLNAQNNASKIRRLRKALLVMHSPQDSIVNVSNAAEIFAAAVHPKSFVSLDGADHLLSAEKDSLYAGQVIGAWASRYLDIAVDCSLETSEQVVVQLPSDAGFTTRIKAGGYFLLADEPASVGGANLGPSPYGLLTAALGACTAMTIKMYARRKNWNLTDVRVHLSHNKIHASDCDCDLLPGKSGKLDQITRVIELDGDLDDGQRARLLEIADRCPVHRTLESDVLVNTRLG